MPTGEVWSAFQKKSVPLHSVGCKGSSFPTIQDAVSRANPGDRIEVGTGLYSESLIINKFIELVAADSQNPELSQWGTALTLCSTGGAYVCGIEVLQADKGGKGEQPSIVVQEGAPTLVDCRFPSIMITGMASPVLRNNEIMGSGTTGVKLRGKGGGTFEGNRIYGHGVYCVDVGNSGETVFTKNVLGPPEGRVSKRGMGIVHCGFDPSQGFVPLFSENQISDPPTTGATAEPGKLPERSTVHVSSDSGATFVDNDFSACEVGIRVSSSSPTISENTFSKMLFCGVAVQSFDSETSAGAQVSANRFMECTECAVYVCGAEAKPEIAENIVYGFNGGNGYIVTEGAAPTLTGNQMSRMPKVGIKVQNASGQYSGNVMENCQGPGILVIGKSAPKMRENSVLRGDMQGIVVVNGARGVFERNEVAQMLCGVVVLGSSPTFTENKLTSCADVSVVIDKKSKGRFVGNVVHGGKTGVTISGVSSPTFEGNTVVQCGDVGLVVTERSTPILRDNKVSETKGTGLEVTGSADPTVTGNTISNNHGYGVDVVGDTYGTYLNNTLQENAYAAMRSAEAAYPVFRCNTLTGSGILCERGGSGVFEKNKIALAETGCVVSGLGTRPMLLSNHFNNITGTSLLASDECKGVVRGCFFTNVEEGVRAESGALPRVEMNVFTSATIAVRVVGRGTAPHVHQNTLRHSRRTGVLLEGCSAIVRQNVFRENQVGLTASSSSTVEHNTFEENEVGVRAEGTSHDTVRANTFSASKAAGVSIAQKAETVFTKNNVSDGFSGFLVDGVSGGATVTDNRIHGNTYGIEARHDELGKGLAVFKGNDIKGSGKAGIWTHTNGFVTAEENKLHGGPVGILCTLKGGGLFRVNTVTGNDSGVSVTTGGNPTVAACHIEYSAVGIAVSEQGRGLFEANRFTKNETHIRSESGGCPTVTKSDLCGSAGSGLVVRKGALGVYKQNRMCDNGGSGVEVESHSDPVLEDNEIANNAEHGVLMRSEAQGKLLDNRVHTNKQAGVFVCMGSRPYLQGNEIKGNRTGVELTEFAMGTLVSNTICSNIDAGVMLSEGTDPQIEGNKIHDEVLGCVFEASRGRFTTNEVYACKVGVEASRKATPYIGGNTLSGNELGMRVMHDAAGRVLDNTFAQNLLGLSLAHGAAPLLEGNRFAWEPATDRGAAFDADAWERADKRVVGLRIVSGGATVKGNRFTGLDAAVVLETAECKAVLRENTVSGGQVGVLVTGRATPRLEANTFSRNAVAGLHVVEGAAPHAEANTFEGESVGLRFGGGGLGAAERNVFKGNVCGCELSGGAATRPTVGHNAFTENETGLLATDAAGGAVRENLFARNTVAGVHVSGAGTTTEVSRNAFAHHDTDAAGVKLSDRCAAQVTRNLLTQNVVGVHLCGSEGTVSHNLLCRHEKTAVLSSSRAGGEVTRNAFKNNATDVTTSKFGNTTFSYNLLEAPTAIACRDSGSGTFQHNSVSGRVVVSSDGCGRFIENFFHDQGVIVRDEGRGEFTDNIFARMAEKANAGLEVTTGGCPDVQGNTFVKLARAVYVHSGGLGSFTDNLLWCGRVGMELGRDADPQVGSGNQFDAQEKAVVVLAGARGAFKDGTQIFGASVAGVWVDKSEPVFHEVEIFDCKTAMHLASGNTGVHGCDVFDNNTGVNVCADAKMTARNNKMTSPMEAGCIVKCDGAKLALENNNIRHMYSPASTSRRPGRADRAEARRKGAPKAVKTALTDAEKLHKQVEPRSVIVEVEDLFRRHRLEPCSGLSAASHGGGGVTSADSELSYGGDPASPGSSTFYSGASPLSPRGGGGGNAAATQPSQAPESPVSPKPARERKEGGAKKVAAAAAAASAAATLLEAPGATGPRLSTGGGGSGGERKKSNRTKKTGGGGGKRKSDAAAFKAAAKATEEGGGTGGAQRRDARSKSTAGTVAAAVSAFPEGGAGDGGGGGSGGGAADPASPGAQRAGLPDHTPDVLLAQEPHAARTPPLPGDGGGAATSAAATPVTATTTADGAALRLPPVADSTVAASGDPVSPAAAASSVATDTPESLTVRLPDASGRGGTTPPEDGAAAAAAAAAVLPPSPLAAPASLVADDLQASGASVAGLTGPAVVPRSRRPTDGYAPASPRGTAGLLAALAIPSSAQDYTHHVPPGILDAAAEAAAAAAAAEADGGGEEWQQDAWGAWCAAASRLFPNAVYRSALVPAPPGPAAQPQPQTAAGGAGAGGGCGGGGRRLHGGPQSRYNLVPQEHTPHSPSSWRFGEATAATAAGGAGGGSGRSSRRRHRRGCRDGGTRSLRRQARAQQQQQSPPPPFVLDVGGRADPLGEWAWAVACPSAQPPQPPSSTKPAAQHQQQQKRRKEEERHLPILSAQQQPAAAAAAAAEVSAEACCDLTALLPSDMLAKAAPRPLSPLHQRRWTSANTISVKKAMVAAAGAAKAAAAAPPTKPAQSRSGFPDVGRLKLLAPGLTWTAKLQQQGLL